MKNGTDSVSLATAMLAGANPVGKVAITTTQASAYASQKTWTPDWDIPTGTVVLVAESTSNRLVKIIWNERLVYVATDELRLVDIGNKFNGLSFCITGELSVPREFFKNLIGLKGGEFKTGVSSKLDYLIVGNPTRVYNNSTKYRKADKLGVKIITEQQFFELAKQG